MLSCPNDVSTLRLLNEEGGNCTQVSRPETQQSGALESALRTATIKHRQQKDLHDRCTHN